MCEASAFIVKEGREELVMESVDLLENEDDQVTLTGLFGEKETIKGRVKALSLVEHKILLEPA
jgi:predicted RNA-binding protein